MSEIKRRLAKLILEQRASRSDILVLNDEDSVAMAILFFARKNKYEPMSLDTPDDLDEFISELREGIRTNITFKGLYVWWFRGEKESRIYKQTLAMLVNC